MIIFKNKVGGRPPSLAQVIASLKSQFKTERFIAINNNKDRFFKGFWSPFSCYKTSVYQMFVCQKRSRDQKLKGQYKYVLLIWILCGQDDRH